MLPSEVPRTFTDFFFEELSRVSALSLLLLLVYPIAPIPYPPPHAMFV